jgi:hypothetical protein
MLLGDTPQGRPWGFSRPRSAVIVMQFGGLWAGGCEPLNWRTRMADPARVIELAVPARRRRLRTSFRIGPMAEDESPHGTTYGLFRHRPPLPSEPGAGKVKVVFDMVRELTKEEYDEAGEAIKVISTVLEGFDNNLNRAYLDLSTSTERLTSTFGRNDALQDVTNWLPELQHRIANFSVALVMHQGYVLSEVGHLYGEDSAELKSAKKILADLYDSSLSYRIVYGFRNAVVHSSRQLTTARAAARLVVTRDGTERIETDIAIRLIRDAFAKTKPNAKRRDEVLGLPEDPELLEACRVAWVETKAAQSLLNPYLYPRRESALRTLWAYLVETATVGGYGPHFHSMLASGQTQKMQNLAMSRSIANYVWESGLREELPGLSRLMKVE